jgi:hypothetical protein
MLEAATNVTCPFDIDQAPSPTTLKLPEVMHELVFAGFTIQLEASAADPWVAKAPTPESMSMKLIVAPGMTVRTCDVALGAVGAPTLGVIVARLGWLKESFAEYLIAVATPEKVDSGVKVTVEPDSV